MSNSIPKTAWIPLVIGALAALLRLLWLDIKPPHFDEGVNGWFVDQMTRNGYYEYDPANYHGPLHFYVLFLFQTLFGRHVWALRLPIVLVSTLTVYWTTLFDRFLGKQTVWLAAVAMAISPAAVFYGRYAIHESWLVFFLILFAWGLAGMWKYGTKGYLWALSMGFTGTVLTKETYIIHFVCFVLAAGCLYLLEKLRPSENAMPPTKQNWSAKDLILCLVVSAGLILFFYSGTFLHWKALKGLYKTFAAWSQTGQEGHGHEKTDYDVILHIGSYTRPLGLKLGHLTIIANYYWFSLIWNYEWPVVFGLLGSLLCFARRMPALLKYLTIYGLGTLAAYSIIPYKTPWCIISLLWPFFFLIGYLPKAASSFLIQRNLAIGCAAMILIVSLLPTITLNYYNYTDEDEPYVYVQTFTDINKLIDPLMQLVKANPANYHLVGHILVSSYHPLPWLLGDFTKIGYYEENSKPDTVDADFLLVEKERVPEIEPSLEQDYFTEEVRLRSAQEPSKLYLSYETFKTLFPDRKPELSHDAASSHAQTR